MKRYLYIIIPFVLMALLAACASPQPTPEPTPTAAPAPTPTPELVEVTPETGEELARDMGCTACHTLDGNPSVGPTWQGLYQSQRPLADASTVLADDSYLRESIVSPNAKVVEGFLPGIMPQNFGDRLSNPEIQAIVEYIKTLR